MSEKSVKTTNKTRLVALFLFIALAGSANDLTQEEVNLYHELNTIVPAISDLAYQVGYHTASIKAAQIFATETEAEEFCKDTTLPITKKVVEEFIKKISPNPNEMLDTIAMGVFWRLEEATDNVEGCGITEIITKRIEYWYEQLEGVSNE
ncbi:MAG: hypothetical protein OXG88_00350 [Gammaproteobacteria bacterium]|nr:hypothetical protein [Gammaproteobacteria bacterium]